MEGSFFLGIDIGTYETKGVLVDEAGRVAAQSRAKHEMENPREGFFEQDAEQVWWRDFCQVARALLSSSGIRPEQIRCVSASTLGSDCLPVDASCRPLRKAILYGIDSRAVEEIRWLEAYYGKEREKRLFGRPICTGDVAPKILWLQRNEPDVYRDTYKFLTGASYITAKLTGNYVVDQFLGQASFRPLYRGMEVNREECELYCRPDQLAVPRWVTDVAGYVTRRAAEETGLLPGTPVTTGTGDSTAEAISTGVLEPGDLMLQFGSTLFLYCCTDRLVEDDRLRGNNFTIPGTYSVAGGTNAAGTLTRWCRNLLYPDAIAREAETGEDAFEQMAKEAAQVPPGSDGLITLPYFAGERTPINDPEAKGMFFGLKLSHTRGHLCRSALEGVGYSIAQHLEILEEREIPIRNILAVGGGTRNPVWMQCVADILEKPLQVAQVSVGAAYGDALIGMIASGHCSSFQDLRRYIRIQKTYPPNPQNYRLYQNGRRIFRELYERNKDLMHSLEGGNACVRL